MEERKIKEIKYYNNRAKKKLEESLSEQEDFEGFNPFLLQSYRYLKHRLQDQIQGKKILDYGCGNGIHSIWLAQSGAGVVGIDLSEHSLKIAQKRASTEKIDNKIKFLKMDCENLKFPDNTFDIIFDGGTFSSLDLHKALPELKRVLKPQGFVIGIETFGHNPLTNLKRKINKATQKRTKWAAEHILTMDSLKEFEKYFAKIKIKFFHPVSWIVFPFINYLGGKQLLKLLETIDKLILKIPALKKYAFKVVFVLKNPNDKASI